jgi:hypothetical protein
MSRSSRRFGVYIVAALAATGCDDGASTADLVPATVRLVQGSALDGAAASLVTSLTAGGRIELSLVDSLIVHVTRVDVLPDSLILRCHPPVGDSVSGFRPMRGDSGPNRPGCRGRGPNGPMGPGLGGGFGGGRFGFPPIQPDSMRPDSGWGRRQSQWYSLAVAGDGRLDLVNLPVEASAGLLLASGDVPAGDYGAARLFISDATIWLNTPVTTDSGVTLQADTGYTVMLPRMVDRMGIATGEGFTIPDGGGTVALVFDAGATIGAAGVRDDGTVMLRPVIRPRPRR